MSEAGGEPVESREFAVSLPTPDPAWRIAIEEIHRVDEALWVISRVSRDPDLMAPQVISETGDRVVVPAPDLPVRHFVLGKTWRWEPEGPAAGYRFIDDRKEIEDRLKEGEPVFRRRPER